MELKLILSSLVLSFCFQLLIRLVTTKEEASQVNFENNGLVSVKSDLQNNTYLEPSDLIYFGYQQYSSLHISYPMYHTISNNLSMPIIFSVAIPSNVNTLLSSFILVNISHLYGKSIFLQKIPIIFESGEQNRTRKFVETVVEHPNFGEFHIKAELVTLSLEQGNYSLQVCYAKDTKYKIELSQEDSLTTFFDWLNYNGAIENIKIIKELDSNNQIYRKAVAKRNLQLGEVMISIPKFLGLTRLLLSFSPIAKYFERELFQVEESTALAMGLIWCKLKHFECPFYWFIASLPTLEDLPYVSYYWKSEYFDAFEGTTIGPFLQGQKDRLNNEVVLLKNLFEKWNQDSDFKRLLDGEYGDMFGWALFCVESRVWGVPSSDGQYLRFGIGLDLLNHRDNATYMDYFTDQNRLQLIANQEVKENEEVFCNYGHYKGTNDWFLYYGFFTNAQQVSLFMDASKPENLLENLEGMDWSMWYQYLKLDDPNSIEILITKRKIKALMAQQSRYELDKLEQFTESVVLELEVELMEKIQKLEDSNKEYEQWVAKYQNETDKNVEYILKASHVFREGEKLVAEHVLKYLEEHYPPQSSPHEEL